MENNYSLWHAESSPHRDAPQKRRFFSLLVSSPLHRILVNTSEEIKLRMINITGRAQVWKLHSSGIRFKFPATSGDAGWQKKKNTITMIGLIRASVLKHTRRTTLRRGDNQRGAAVLMSILLHEAFVQGGISLSCSHWKECMLHCMILHIPSGLGDRVIMKHIR